MSSRRKNRGDISRYFHEVVKEDIPRREQWHCDTIHGSRSFHSVASISAADPTKLMVRYLACFCQACQLHNWDNCEYTSHVDPWSVVQIRVQNTRLVRTQMITSFEECDDSQFGGDEDELTDYLTIGQNFAVLAEDGNSEGVPYYVLHCQRPQFVVREAFACVWGNQFEVGDHAVEGTYYQKWGPQNYVYLSTSRPAYIHSHLVIARGFPMMPQNHRVQGRDPTYKILHEHHQLILANLHR